MTTGLVNLKTCLATSNNIFLKTILAKSKKVDILIPNAHIFLCTYSLIKPSCFCKLTNFLGFAVIKEERHSMKLTCAFH